MQTTIPRHTAASRVDDEVERFYEPLTDAELAQFARWTWKRPVVGLLLIVALLAAAEPLCRLADWVMR